jgi:hypothetical protein
MYTVEPGDTSALGAGSLRITLHCGIVVLGSNNCLTLKFASRNR